MSYEAKSVIVVVGIALLIGALVLLAAGCTYNQVTFEKDSVRFADDVTVEPGQASDTTDSGATGAPTTGGAGKRRFSVKERS